MFDFLKNFFLPKNTQPKDTEVVHINQELYKKGAELAEKNKTLSLLRTIDEIVLSTMTKQDEVAQQVTKFLISDSGFQLASIFILNKEINTLERRGLSDATSQIPDTAINSEALEILSELHMDKVSNKIVQSIKEKNVCISYTLKDTLMSANISDDKVIEYQNAKSLRTILVYPLLVRNEAIGAMVIGLKDSEQDIPEFQKDLLERLSRVIGFGIDNALLYNQVQLANQKLKELDKLKTEFVSVASHELRTPMTAIKSYLWMALDGRGGHLEDKQKFYIERAYNSSDRLIKMVNDMLNISRIESGRLTVSMQEVDLNALVQEVIEEVQPRADELGVHVTLAKDETLSKVIADPDKIKEVVFNLVGNSMKFIPKDGHVQVWFEKKNDVVITHVKDDGVGLEAEDLPKLFQKFGLLPGSYTTNQATQGTGLGLYICKSIVELHEGTIRAASEGKGKGAEFTFSLKIFNEDRLKKFSSKFGAPENPIGLIHSQV